MAECIRLYSDGTHITNVRETKEEVESWLEYNKKYRFGTALFVDGKCVEKGVYLSKERCDAFEKELFQKAKRGQK